MNYNTFISYAAPDQDIVENLKDHLERYGVNSWVYSLDRTLAEDAWKEIEDKLNSSTLVIFVVSDNTPNAKGQMKELELAILKVTEVTGIEKIMPVVISGTNFSDLPEELKYKNGIPLSSHTVKSVAWDIASSAFPNLTANEINSPWRFPIPGEWLEISNIETTIEGYFDIGDKLYFRSISPIGLFECYSPKINGLFWVSPKNVQVSKDTTGNNNLEKQIPAIYKVSGMIEISSLGWASYKKSNKG